MKRFVLAAMGTLAILLAAARPSAAQAPFQNPFPNPIQPPTRTPPVSPFINLFRAGNSAAINYYGLVRPEIEFRNSYQRLQQQVTDIQQQSPYSPEETSGLPPTGHFAQFNTQGRYFMTRGAAAPTVASPSSPVTPPFRPATMPLRTPIRPPGM